MWAADGENCKMLVAACQAKFMGNDVAVHLQPERLSAAAAAGVDYYYYYYYYYYDDYDYLSSG